MLWQIHLIRGDGLWRPTPGGSALNCALTVGLIGGPVPLVSALSSDSFGNLPGDRLSEYNVKLRLNFRSEA